MKISKERLLAEASRTGFRREMLEKVLHLLNLLEGFKRHPFLKERLVLKGGTALNIFHLECPRLSVDIDLNYIASVDRDTMLQERPQVDTAIKAVCEGEGFTISRKPTEHAGGKWRISYASALGQGGNLAVDINYLLRSPIFPIQERKAYTFGSYGGQLYPVLDLHELAGGKLAALFSRHASRDLFDAHWLLTQVNLNPAQLRLAFVLYGAMSRKDWRTVSENDITFEAKDLDNMLVPLLRRQSVEEFSPIDQWAKTLAKECRQALAVLLPFSKSEQEFLDRLLDYGEIKPDLLTDDTALSNCIETHPALHWKAKHVREFKSGSR